MVNVPDFEALYQADADPWQVRSSFYEARKLDLLLACLSRPMYDAAWDPSCGVGELAAGSPRGRAACWPPTHRHRRYS